MSYSMNPVLDEIRYSEAMECAEAMQDARIKTLYDDTMDAVKRGDLSRIVETFAWDDVNAEVAVSALNVGRAHGSVSASQAIQALAQVWANQYAKD